MLVKVEFRTVTVNPDHPVRLVIGSDVSKLIQKQPLEPGVAVSFPSHAQFNKLRDLFVQM